MMREGFAGIESLLAETIGLDVTSLGPEMVGEAIRRRMQGCGCEGETDYLREIRRSPKEFQALVEAMLVPETWFFRDGAPFAFLREYTTEAWRSSRGARKLRLLSAPCASGEEAYSIALTLLEAGIPPEGFQLLAADISPALLRRAEVGRYTAHSFRAGEVPFRTEYIRCSGDTFVVQPALRAAVRFVQGNLVDARFLEGETPFDAIFCRNLLIYLTPAARTRVVETLDRLLAADGILVVGHAEMLPMLAERLQPVPSPGAFAYRRPRVTPARIPVPPSQTRTPSAPAKRGSRGPASVRTKGSGRPGPPATPDRRPARSADHFQGLLARATRLADAGRLHEAAALCQKVVEFDPVNTEAHYLLGVILDASGEAERAEQCLSRAIYLDGRHYEAILHLSLLKRRRGDLGGAEALRRRAARIDHRDRENWGQSRA